jgi:outer membrane immunogenic protein
VNRIKSSRLTNIGVVALAATLVAAPATAKEGARGFSFGMIGGFETYDLDVKTSEVVISNLELDGPTLGAFVSVMSTMPDLGGLIGGFEANYRWSDADGKIVVGDDIISVKARESWGIDAKLGFEPATNLLVYGRAGWLRTNFRGLDVGSDDLDGFRFGAGAEFAIGSNLSLRGELTRTVYEDFKSSESKIETGQNALTLGIGYYF